jgi:hypothetical protein
VQTVLALITGTYGKDDVGLEHASTIVSQSSNLILFYFVSLFGFAYVVGLGAHHLVRYYKWDHKSTLLRFKNDWHYLLNGEILQFPENQLPVLSRIDGVHVTVGVTLGGEAFLYRGFLVDYYLNSQGQLDRIAIMEADRRKLSDDRDLSQQGEDADGRFYPIDGHVMLLRMSEVQTMNIKFVEVDLADEATDSNSDAGPGSGPGVETTPPPAGS